VAMLALLTRWPHSVKKIKSMEYIVGELSRPGHYNELAS